MSVSLLYLLAGSQTSHSGTEYPVLHNGLYKHICMNMCWVFSLGVFFFFLLPLSGRAIAVAKKELSFFFFLINYIILMYFVIKEQKHHQR